MNKDIAVRRLDGSNVVQGESILDEYNLFNNIKSSICESLEMFCRPMPLAMKYRSMMKPGPIDSNRLILPLDSDIVKALQISLLDGSTPLTTFRHYYKIVLMNKPERWGVSKENFEDFKFRHCNLYNLESYLDNLQVINPKDNFTEVTESDFVEDIVFINTHYTHYFPYVIKKVVGKLPDCDLKLSSTPEFIDVRLTQEYLSKHPHRFEEFDKLYKIRINKLMQKCNAHPGKFLGIEYIKPCSKLFQDYLSRSIERIRIKLEYSPCLDLIKLKYQDVVIRNCKNKSPKILVD